jgi:ferrous iron transport protein B
MGWSWELVLALISGFFAKEVVVATIGVLNIDIVNIMSWYQAFAFMLFTLLYIPCLATIAAIKAEIGTKWVVVGIAYTFTVAYVIAVLVTGVGVWLSGA